MLCAHFLSLFDNICTSSMLSEVSSGHKSWHGCPCYKCHSVKHEPVPLQSQCMNKDFIYFLLSLFLRVDRFGNCDTVKSSNSQRSSATGQTSLLAVPCFIIVVLILCHHDLEDCLPGFNSSRTPQTPVYMINTG